MPRLGDALSWRCLILATPQMVSLLTSFLGFLEWSHYMLTLTLTLTLVNTRGRDSTETKLQLAGIFTKPLPKERFFFLRNELGILDLNNLS